MEHAVIEFDPERDGRTNWERVKMIQNKLAAYGIRSFAFHIDNFGHRGPSPWLTLNGHIIYANEMGDQLESLDERIVWALSNNKQGKL